MRVISLVQHSRLLLAIGLCGYTFTSQAQGVYQKLPGVKNPTAWQDTAYNPPVVDGAMHLRLGRSGVTGFAGVVRDSRITGTTLGEPNCDINYLFHAKANTLPDPTEVSVCAGLEERIRNAGGSAPRDMTNTIVKAEVEKEWEAWMKQRIQTMKGYQRFYFRPSNIFLKPYDVSRRTFDIDINFEGPKGTYFRQAVFINKMMDSTGRRFETRISPNDALARDMEWSRANDFIDSGMASVHFNVDRVENVNSKNYGLQRGFQISKVSWSLGFFRQDGVRSEITISD